MITLFNVSRYFDQLCAIDQVFLTISKGQIVGLIGPNGSGKSTLLNVVSGVLPASSGNTVFNDQDITHHSVDEIFQLRLVRSFQDPSLFFRMSVLDNALLPAKAQIGEKAAYAPFHGTWTQQETDLAQEASQLLDRLVNRNLHASPASDISGGQMKLLKLWRSLAGKPCL